MCSAALNLVLQLLLHGPYHRRGDICSCKNIQYGFCLNSPKISPISLFGLEIVNLLILVKERFASPIQDNNKHKVLHVLDF